MARSLAGALVLSLLFQQCFCKLSSADADKPATLHDLEASAISSKDADLIAKDTGSLNDVRAIMDEIDVAESIENNPFISDDKERQEAIETGTLVPSADEERQEAIESGTLVPSADEEREEAIKSGTFVPSESDSNKNDDSWLPPKLSITEEIDEINKVDGAKGLVDGDIMPPDNPNDYEGNENEKRNALRDRAKIWRDAVLPYIFDPSLTSQAITVINSVIAEYQQKTCIRFKRLSAPGNEHYIRFIHGYGCYSYVGKISGRSQNVSIGRGCEHKGIVIHELMHALGFYHEQSRYDRDNYVKIDFANVLSGRENNFKKQPIEKITGLGLPYDYDGVMHYGKYAFSKNGQPTIVKLSPTGPEIGQRKGFSVTDLKQINILYDCKTDRTKNSWSSWSAWSSCINLGSGKKEHSQRFCFRSNPSLCPGANSKGTQSRERVCSSGPATAIPPAPVTYKTTKAPAPGGRGICGTRGSGLAHPAMDPQHIVGGANALPGDWPWQVGIARKGSSFVYCGGTLVSDEWVISAAHCFSASSQPSKITARLGDHNRNSNEGTEQIITLSKIIRHPNYNSRTVNNDIALLKLSRPVKFTKYIRPACVPSSSDVIPVGTKAFVSGWGATAEGGSTSSILQVANVPVISESDCKRSYRGITSQMVCAGYARGGVDSCQGDSGGPLVYQNKGGRFYLGGIVSFGIGCARPNRPGVYARVSALRSFINQHISGLDPVIKPPRPTGVGPNPQPLLQCTFQTSLCNWKQAKNDKFDWTRRTGRTPSSLTGPSSSSTGVSGYYLYIETSYPRRTGDVATIVSPSVSSSIPRCLTLKAHMYGSGTGALNIFVVKDGTRKEIFGKRGDQGNKWFDVKADLPAGGPYEIEISGVRGRDYRGDIAIDQISLQPYSCAGKPTPAPALLQCTFQTSLCNWKQAKNDKFDWTRRTGRTPSSLTGPSSSSTGVSGYYLYIETSYPRRTGDVATIVSPSVSSSIPRCLTLKAHMYGSGTGALNIFVVKDGTRKEIFGKRGDQGNKWFDVKAGVPAGGPYEIEISGVRGRDYRGDIAIDQISLQPYSCAGSTPSPQPQTTPSPQRQTTPSSGGSCGAPQIAAARVIAGKDVVRGSWPWQILMLYRGRPICGGTLINPTTVVTAAHCVSGRESSASSFAVRVGEHDTRVKEGSEIDIGVSGIIPHPLYKRSTIDYDIAVMKLAKPATLGKYVGVACLPAAGQEPPVGSTCYITGFGKVKHPGNMYHTLQQASMKVVSKQDCTNLNTASFRIPITDRMICAGNGRQAPQSGCHGDSGGPFVCQSGGKWYLQGAVSWGSSTCDSSKSYTVFAKVSNKVVNEWIRKLA